MIRSANLCASINWKIWMKDESIALPSICLLTCHFPAWVFLDFLVFLSLSLQSSLGSSHSKSVGRAMTSRSDRDERIAAGEGQQTRGKKSRRMERVDRWQNRGISFAAISSQSMEVWLQSRVRKKKRRRGKGKEKSKGPRRKRGKGCF